MSPGAPRNFIRTLWLVRASGLLARARLLRLARPCAFAFLAQLAFGPEPMVHIPAIHPPIALVYLVRALRNLVAAETHLCLAGLAIASRRMRSVAVPTVLLRRAPDRRGHCLGLILFLGLRSSRYSFSCHKTYHLLNGDSVRKGIRGKPKKPIRTRSLVTLREKLSFHTPAGIPYFNPRENG